MRQFNRGDSFYVPFQNGKSIADSQLRPRMYKSKEQFYKSFPKHNLSISGIELVEYAEKIPVYNKALSIDQLQNMQWQPIYICKLTPMGEIREFWLICDIFHGALINPRRDMSGLRGQSVTYELKDYGNTWVAYARKPEVCNEL